MKPKNEGLEDDFPFQTGDLQVNHVNFPGCTNFLGHASKSLKWQVARQKRRLCWTRHHFARRRGCCLGAVGHRIGWAEVKILLVEL